MEPSTDSCTKTIQAELLLLWIGMNLPGRVEIVGRAGSMGKKGGERRGGGEEALLFDCRQKWRSRNLPNLVFR